jgi:methyl-accepting chemotaxis protein
VKSAAIADSVRRDAESGKSSLDATLEGIQAIGKAARTTSEVIQSLSGKAQNIGQVLSVIEEVTDQTNLLALNAAIIAAQAGEKGKGFAVVAEEIRELADRTGISTREITQMIQGIQRETRQAVEAIFVAEKKVQEGETLSRQTGDLLGRIFAGVQETSAQMERIAVATAQQAAGSRMIRQAMENISQLINESARATREQDGGASLITQAAEQIKELAAQVRLSTREQSEASRVIARAMENVSEKIAGIRTACEMQQRESNQIVAALGDIQASTGENVEATRGLQKVVGILGEETGVLQQEMAAFEITEESGEPTAI